MALLWAMLPVFLVCAEAQNVTEVRGKLGGSINLKCSENFSNIYWYMEIHSRFRVEILRTFSQNSEPSYCSVDFKSKFSIQRNELVITNITSGEYRLYFCAKRIQDRISYVDAIRLVSGLYHSLLANTCLLRFESWTATGCTSPLGNSSPGLTAEVSSVTYSIRHY